MKRLLSVGLVVGAMAFPVTAGAQAPAAPRAARNVEDPNAPKIIEVTKLRDNVFLLRGGGGNTTIFITSTGVVVVDTKNPGWGTALMEKIKTLTDKPVTAIVNTHTHADHVSGNVEFPATIDVVAHEQTKALMAEMRPSVNDDDRGTAPAQVFKLNGGRNLPKRTYTDKVSIGSGNDRVDVYNFGPSHTGGDSFVVFPAGRVMVAGDVFSNKNLPNIDTNNGGRAVGYPHVLARAAQLPDVDLVIPGHSGAPFTAAELKEYAEFNREFMEFADRQMKAGKSVDEAAAEYKTSAKYQGYGAPQAERVKRNLQQYYAELRQPGTRP